MTDVRIENSWKEHLIDEFSKPYMRDLSTFLRIEKSKNKTIYPPSHLIFNAFELTRFDDVKIVILGQDPYHGKGQAHGLSFSVQKGIRLPPSLQNIYKELNNDLDIPISNNGNLSSWCKQGVLLLNSILTVEQGKPASHSNMGWEKFTDRVLETLNNNKSGIVHILWGKKAQEKCSFIDQDSNLVIQSPHPSPYSAHSGFFGSKPFSKANEYLKSNNKKEVNWQIP